MKKLSHACIAALLMLASAASFSEGKAAFVAVAANGNTASASVGNQAGRSPYFLLFDSRGVLAEVVDNPYRSAGNSGISAIDFLASKGAAVVVAEGFGPKIVDEMKSRGLRAVEFKGSAADAAKKAGGSK
jgi:predicted Fe-Mo cluster-binding NifX family protein